MIINVMAIRNRNKQVELFKVKNSEGETFKDKFVKVYILDEADRVRVEKLGNEALTKSESEGKKSGWFEIVIPENSQAEGEKANSYWISKKTDKYNERFFIVKLGTDKVSELF